MKPLPITVSPSPPCITVAGGEDVPVGWPMDATHLLDQPLEALLALGDAIPVDERGVELRVNPSSIMFPPACPLAGDPPIGVEADHNSTREHRA